MPAASEHHHWLLCQEILSPSVNDLASIRFDPSRLF
jgi:hypothetical protein